MKRYRVLSGLAMAVVLTVNGFSARATQAPEPSTRITDDLPTIVVAPTVADDHTVVKVYLPYRGEFSLGLFDADRNMLLQLANYELMERGEYAFYIELGSFAPGTYFVAAMFNDYRVSRQIDIDR